MSIVNAFINQIGREIGRDVYKKVRGNSSKYINTYSSTEFNEDFYNEIKDFKLAAYDKVSIKNLVNLIEKSDNINTRSFNWQDCYVELDNKIDLCKEHLDKEHIDKLESLDKQNAFNFSVAKEGHKTFLKETIQNIQTEIENYENKSSILALAISIVGLNPIYFRLKFGKIFSHLFGTIIGGICIYYGFNIYMEPTTHHGNLSIKNESDINILKNVGITIMIIGFVFYLPVLINSIRRIISEQKNNSNRLETLNTLNKYLVDLNKSK